LQFAPGPQTQTATESQLCACVSHSIANTHRLSEGNKIEGKEPLMRNGMKCVRGTEPKATQQNKKRKAKEEKEVTKRQESVRRQKRDDEEEGERERM
jgi:hypothetical protein